MLTAETVDATARACFDMHRLEAPFTSGTKGVMHACGHDGHTAIAITMAEIMSARRAEVAGTSVFIFQPAEEVISGAEPMIAAGVLDDPHVDEVYGLHLTTLTAAGHVEVRPGPSMASCDYFEIDVWRSCSLSRRSTRASSLCCAALAQRGHQGPRSPNRLVVVDAGEIAPGCLGKRSHVVPARDHH